MYFNAYSNLSLCKDIYIFICRYLYVYLYEYLYTDIDSHIDQAIL